MSTENLTAFFSHVGSDPDLAAKVASMESLSKDEKATALAKLSAETGTPFNEEELLAFFATPLSDEELSGVAGGRGAPNNCSHEENARRKENFNQFLSDTWDTTKKYGSYTSGIGLVSKLFN